MAEKWTDAKSFEEVKKFAEERGGRSGITIYCHEARWKKGYLSATDLDLFKDQIESHIVNHGSISVCPSSLL